VLKHFPGHGSAIGDSHLGFTDVTGTWSSIELQPYAHLIAAGTVDAVMTGHLYNANLDSLYPSTLSAATLRSLTTRLVLVR
jgi:beta-N-acetylhexosaminidase